MIADIKKEDGVTTSWRTLSGSKFRSAVALFTGVYGIATSIIIAVWLSRRFLQPSVGIVGGVFGGAATLFAVALSMIGYIKGKDCGGFSMCCGSILGSGCILTYAFGSYAGVCATSAILVWFPIGTTVVGYFVLHKKDELCLEIKNKICEPIMIGMSSVAVVQTAYGVSSYLIESGGMAAGVCAIFPAMIFAVIMSAFWSSDGKSYINALGVSGGAFAFLVAITGDLLVACIAGAVMILSCAYPTSVAIADIVKAKTVKPRVSRAGKNIEKTI